MRFLRSLWKSARRHLPATLTAALALLLVVAAFFFWHVSYRVESTLDTQRAILQQEKLMPVEKVPLSSLSPLNAEWMPTANRITDLLLLPDAVLIGSTDGLHVFDHQGNPQRHLKITDGWPAGDIQRLTFHQGLAIVAVAGKGFIVYDAEPYLISPVDSSGKESTDLLSTPQGDLWIATRTGGLLVWRNQRLERPFAGHLQDTHITALAGNSLDLWIGTYNNGIVHYSRGSWKRLTKQDGLPDNQITCLGLDDQGTLYAGTPLGTAIILGDRITARALEPEFVNSLAILKNQIFACTLAGNCYLLESRQHARRIAAPASNTTKENPEPVRLKVSDSAVWASRGDRVWKATAADRRIEWQEFLSIRPSSATTLSDRNITSLVFDSAANLWVGYFEDGLDIVQLGRESLRHFRDDTLFCVNSIAFDERSKTAFVATANGLAIFRSTSEYRVLRTEDGLIHNHVTDVRPKEAGSHTLFAATAGGLSIVDPTGVRSINVLHGLPSNRLYCLAPHAEGLYVGTLAGISNLIANQTPRNFSHENSPLRHNWINALLLDGSNLWIGTYGGGLQLLQDGRQWKSIAPELSHWRINPNALFSIDDCVYAGSQDAGFLAIDKKTLKWKQVRTPLPSQNVTSFAADSDFLYVGTDCGLMRFRLAELKNLAQEGTAK